MAKIVQITERCDTGCDHCEMFTNYNAGERIFICHKEQRVLVYVRHRGSVDIPIPEWCPLTDAPAKKLETPKPTKNFIDYFKLK